MKVCDFKEFLNIVFYAGSATKLKPFGTLKKIECINMINLLWFDSFHHVVWIWHALEVCKMQVSRKGFFFQIHRTRLKLLGKLETDLEGIKKN